MAPFQLGCVGVGSENAFSNRSLFALMGTPKIWYPSLCARIVTGFYGSATKPCGPCFTPQSATKRLVASALSFGRHSEEPRVVVTKGNTDRTKFDGARRQGFVGLFLVTRCNFSAKHGRNLEFRAFVQRRVLGIPAAPYHGVVRHPTTQKSLSPWP